MPMSKAADKKPEKPEKESTLVPEYTRLFKAKPSPKWRSDETHFSLDQPWPYEFPETETSYGIVSLANA
jgi:hypothetical protein